MAADPAERRMIGAGREAEILEWDDGRVLRLLRDAGGRARLEREASAIAAAGAAGVPVPATFGVITFEGRPGLVMTRVDGTDLMTGLSNRPWRILGAARRLGGLQARLHDPVAPPDLRDLRAQLRARIDDAPHLPTHLRAHVLGLLADLPDGDRICHGDFHPGNVILGVDGPVVIDWTNATRGDPTGDLARTVLLLRCAAPPSEMPTLVRAVDRRGRQLFRRVWVRGYRATRPIDDDALTRWETVHAAARLAERVEEEAPSLVALVERRTSSR